MIKKAFITGATSGIGEALSRLMANQGINLLLTGRNQEKLRQLTDSLSGEIAVTTFRADLSHHEERESLIGKMRDFQPDLIVNCAGLGFYGEITEHTTAEQLEILEVNVTALTEITIQAVKMFKEECRQGIIVNVSSVAGFYLIPCFSIYAASKAYVTLFSESVDAEMKPYGIRILAACPGQVHTQFRQRAAKGKDKKQLGIGVMEPSFAAEQIWKQIMWKKSVYIFDWKYRLTTFLALLLPKSLLASLLKKTIFLIQNSR